MEVLVPHLVRVAVILDGLDLAALLLSVALLVKVEENVWLQTLASVQAVWKDLFAVQIPMSVLLETTTVSKSASTSLEPMSVTVMMDMSC
jgi:hypothetical protein